MGKFAWKHESSEELDDEVTLILKSRIGELEEGGTVGRVWLSGLIHTNDYEGHGEQIYEGTPSKYRIEAYLEAIHMYVSDKNSSSSKL